MTLLIFIIGACWGSFLNLFASRLLANLDWIKKRSFCPACKKTIYWYDLIPIISWIALKARCRSCHQPISWRYPISEIFTGLLAVILYYKVPSLYFPAYTIFFSALLVTIFTDLQAMVIFRLTTWGVMPFAFVSSTLGLLPITLIESMIGVIFGFFLLWIIRKLFWLYKKQEGLGLGDLDLLALIGSFTGIKGAWLSLTIGSMLGVVFGTAYAFYIASRTSQSIRQIRIPFGPFLALGAIIYIIIPHLAALVNPV